MENEPFHERRAFFDEYAEKVDVTVGRYGRRCTCPCCGYPTLGGRASYQICFLCSWEDDGQDDSNVDDRDGPNHGLSLAEARSNFENHLVMYEPGHDPRTTGEDTEEELAEKRKAVAAFEELQTAEAVQHPQLWETIRSTERALFRILKKQIQYLGSGG